MKETITVFLVNLSKYIDENIILAHFFAKEVIESCVTVDITKLLFPKNRHLGSIIWAFVFVLSLQNSVVIWKFSAMIELVYLGLSKER